MIMPRLWLGTRKLTTNECAIIIPQAITLGYRHIDTASVYQNEHAIGQAIQTIDIPRHELWITSKIFSSEYHTNESIIASIEQSLKHLQTEYLDLMLLHRPTTLQDHHRVIDILLQYKQQGKIKHIGVSNFNSTQLLDSIHYSKNQIEYYQWEYHICLDQSIILWICDQHSIMFQAYSPLAHGKLRNNDIVMTKLTTIATKHQTSIAQIMLSWLRSQDIILLPKSTKQEHLIENLMHSPILLDDMDMTLINWFPKDFRYCNPRQIAPQRDEWNVFNIVLRHT